MIIEKLKISSGNIRHYALLFTQYKNFQLKQLGVSKSAIYALCHFCDRYRQIKDNLSNAYRIFVRKYSEAAKSYAEEKVAQSAAKLHTQIKSVADVLHLLTDNRTSQNNSVNQLLKSIFLILPKDEMKIVAEYLSNAELDKKRFIWQFYDKNKAMISRNVRRLFLAIDFDIESENTLLSKQIHNAKIELNTQHKVMSIDRRLIKMSNDLNYLVDETAEDESIDQFRFECYFHQLVCSALDGGQCFVPESHQYRSLGADLIGDKDWKNSDNILKSLSLPRLLTPISETIELLQQELQEKITAASDRVSSGENQYAGLSTQSGGLKWSQPYKANPYPVNNPFFEQLPHKNIADLIRIVHDKTSFLESFCHFQEKYQRTKPNFEDIVACIIGNGTNFGLQKIANISDRRYLELRMTQSNFMSNETLRLAHNAITNATSNLPIFEYYKMEDGELYSSIDGQKFECKFSSLMARYSPKYFGTDKGISVMTLVAGHLPIYCKAIPANEHESHHIFDLLYNNTSEVDPDVVSTDTHGDNKFNFAILNTFGYRFAPRYAKYKNQFASVFSVKNTADKNQIFSLKKTINCTLIESEWDNICRIMASLGQKRTSQSILIKKLCRFKSKARTLQALAEYNRALKAIYLLDYVDNETLRRYVQKTLNQGEAFHQLRRVIAEINGKQFRGSHEAEIELWNECARLIANCIIYYNALILSRLKEYFEERESNENLELLKRIFPVAWQHINLSGFYTFASNDEDFDLEALINHIRVDV